MPFDFNPFYTQDLTSYVIKDELTEMRDSLIAKIDESKDCTEILNGISFCRVPKHEKVKSFGNVTFGDLNSDVCVKADFTEISRYFGGSDIGPKAAAQPSNYVCMDAGKFNKYLMSVVPENLGPAAEVVLYKSRNRVFSDGLGPLPRADAYESAASQCEAEGKEGDMDCLATKYDEELKAKEQKSCDILTSIRSYENCCQGSTSEICKDASIALKGFPKETCSVPQSIEDYIGCCAKGNYKYSPESCRMAKKYITLKKVAVVAAAAGSDLRGRGAEEMWS